MLTAPPLIGTYSAPEVKRGEVVTCLYRDRDCTITTMSNAPITWPRCQPRGEQGGSGLWVNAELLKAIKTESAAALKHWFGVSVGVVWRWRKAFGVGGRLKTTKGTKHAIRAAAKLGAQTQKARVWTDAERRAQSRRSKRLKLKPTGRWKGKEWTPEQVAMLGTDHDKAIAKQLGRTRRGYVAAGEAEDTRLLRLARGGRAWTAEEVALLGTATDEVAANRLGRTRCAVSQKRLALGIRRRGRREAGR